MELQSRKEGVNSIVTLSGRLDAVTSPEFEKKVRELIGGGDSRFVIDLEGLDYISSAGLRVLLVMAKLVEEKGGTVCLAGVQGNVRSVFDMSRFNAIFRMEDTVAAAVAALG